MRINSIFKNQQLLFISFLILGTLAALWILGDLASPILLSIVLVFLFRPVLIYLTQIGIPRKIGVIITFFIILGTVTAFFLIYVPLFFNEAQRYLSDVPSFEFLIEPLESFLSGIDAPVASVDNLQSIFSDVTTLLSDTISFGISQIQQTAGFVIGMILVPIFVFFWLWDTETLSSGFLKFLPKKKKFLVRVWNETNDNFQNYFRGKLIEVLVVSVVGSLMFWILGLNTPLLVGTSVGLSQLIPFFGPVFMTIPILVVSLAQFGFDLYVLVIIACFSILQFVDGNIFLPFLMSGVVKIPAVVVLLSVFFFGAIFGIWGVFFSVPLAAFVKSFLDNLKYSES